MLRNCSNLDQSYADVTSNKSLRTVGAIDPSNHFNQISNGTLNIIPWAGNFYKDGQNVELVNTCPIDNYLMMFDYLYQDRKVEIDQLPAPLPNILQQIHELLVDKEFGEAKYKWLDNLPNPPVITNGKVDVFGNENQTVITGLAKVLSNTVTSTCSEPNCPLPVRSVKSYSIELGLLPGRKTNLHNYILGTVQCSGLIIISLQTVCVHPSPAIFVQVPGVALKENSTMAFDYYYLLMSNCCLAMEVLIVLMTYHLN